MKIKTLISQLKKFIQNCYLIQLKITMMRIFYKKTKQFGSWKIKYLCSEKKSEIIEQQKKEDYEIIDRKYDETNVPGIEDRLYSNLSQLQRQIIKQNKFDLANPQLKPKAGGVSSYVGIDDMLTQINLGKVKVKQQNEVFLSQVDPYNIPEDLNVKFDFEKEMKMVGKQTNQRSENGQVMRVKQSTFQLKGIDEFFEKQFGFKKSYIYSAKQKLRISIISAILFLFFTGPLFETLSQVRSCLKSIHEIQGETKKEIEQVKKKYLIKALLTNPDFKYTIQ